MWVSWVCLFLLSYPQTDFGILTVGGVKTFRLGLNVYAFTGLMFVLGVAWAPRSPLVCAACQFGCDWWEP